MLGTINKMLLLLILTACNNSLSVTNDLSTTGISIKGLDRLSAKPGEIVTVTGSNLTDDIEVLVNGTPAKFQRIDNKSGTIEMPADLEAGLVRITFSRKSKPISSLPLMNGNSIENMSPTTAPLDSICDSYIIKTENGELARGNANCKGEQALCQQDGQSECTTTADFPAVVKDGLATKVIEGQSVAGVNGTATADCDD